MTLTSNEAAVRVAVAAAHALRRRSFMERARRATAKAVRPAAIAEDRIDLPMTQLIREAANVRAKAARLAQERP